MGSLLKNNIRKIIPIICFLVTFLWQNIIFVGSGNWDYSYSMARDNNIISDTAELRMVNILSRILCLVIIALVWKIIFYISDGNVKKSDMIILGIIFAIGLICGLFLYPDYFGLEVDNYFNYLMVRRFQPTYWQSIYTGIMWSACLMIIPHPIGIFVFQWIFFWGACAYLYINLGQMYPTKCYKYIVLLLFALPDSYYLQFNPYRNNLFTILVLICIAIIYNKSKYNDNNLKKEIIAFAVFFGYLMVLRSEGIFVGIAATALYIIFIARQGIIANLKIISIMLIVLTISFLTLNSIQGIGSKKYYGRDYMILGTTVVLHSVLNNPDSNLEYLGVEDDLAAIEEVIPVVVLKETYGYRSYNWTCGRKDFNQTLATDEQSKDYMVAYWHIVTHNIDTFLETQLNRFFEALGLSTSNTIYEYTGETTVSLEQIEYDWYSGREEILNTAFTASWSENDIRIAGNSILIAIITTWREMFYNSGTMNIIKVFSIIVVVLLFLKEIICSIDRGRISLFSSCFVIAFGTILCEYLAIMMFMPEGREQYLYPMQYASYVLIFLYYIESKKAEAERE